MSKRTILVIALATSILLKPDLSNAALPVIDAAVLTQSTITAIEDVAQTLKQIEEYKTQLEQYQNQLQNTAAPAMYIWDKATKTMNDLRAAVDTLNYYKKKYRSINEYLKQFKNVGTYRGSPCYSKTGCSKPEWEKMRDENVLGSESQKMATDSLFMALDKQHDLMESDAAQLEKLQRAAQGATGQMQALGYANQLASNQANQLLQIRALLVSQQNVIATRQQALADQEAIQQVSREKFYKTPTASNRAVNKGF